MTECIKCKSMKRPYYSVWYRLMNMTLVPMCRFINGMKAQHTPLKDARIVFYGAGSSAVGVATMIAQLISKETGIPFDEAKKVPPPSCLTLPSAFVSLAQAKQGCPPMLI